MLETIRDALWDSLMPALLLGIGLFLTLRTGFPQFRLPTVWRSTFGALKREGRGGLFAMLTALGGTIGTGNIVGVAVALTSGGPGALLWMWVAALVGMGTKYAEIALSVRYRVREGGTFRGGPMYVLSRGLHAPWAGGVFAVLCVLTSFGIGSTVQSNAAAAALEAGFSVPPFLTGLTLTALLLLSLEGGLERIQRINGLLVPVMGVLYLLGAAVCLLLRADRLGDALASVCTAAFRGVSPEGIPAPLGGIAGDIASPLGGIAGYTVSQAMRFGVARGLFTNEAGMGSAPIAHAAAPDALPEKQGRWGVAEVGLDTLLMCTLTGLVLLTADPSVFVGTDGFTATLAAFSCTLGSTAGVLLCGSMFFFAFASMLAWAFYGQSALQYLTGGRGISLYRAAFSLSALLGAVADPTLLWALSDLTNAAMSLPNLTALLLLYLPGRGSKKSLLPE